MNPHRALSPFSTIGLLLLFIGLCAQLRAADAKTVGQSQADNRKKLVMLIAEYEYHTWENLPAFAAKHLANDFRVVVVSGSASSKMGFDRIEEINDADLLLVSVFRRTPPKRELDIIRRYVASGRPVIGVRNAAHAFVLRQKEGKKPAAGEEDWPSWDADIFGGNYRGHHPPGPITTVTAASASHPILRGVELPFATPTKLYRVSPLKSNAQAILIGEIPNAEQQPVAYIATHSGGGRAFYTSLGGPDDFKIPAYLRLLRNAIYWAAGKSNDKETNK